MQVSKTKRVSNYNLDFMIICLAENIIEHCKHCLQRIVIVIHVRTISGYQKLHPFTATGLKV